MNIGNISSLYLDDSRFSASSLGIGGRAGDTLRPAASGGLPSFAELLDKAQNRETPPEAATSPGTPISNPENAPPPSSPLLPPSSFLTPNSSLLTPHSSKPVVDKTGKLYEQCEALETFLVKTLITGMRNTIQKSEFLDGGFAGKMYEDMLYDEYAKDFSKNANFGLAELAYLELTGQRGKLTADQT
ncbi:MAG: rod-binding protein [Spirochaetaceae bacterium]|jgi:flagellar protein FlgJ|nr:rod-binding protein [Spirochaetaceae bacterium]